MTKPRGLAATLLLAAALLATGTGTASAAPAPTLSVFAFNVDLGTAIVDSIKNEKAAERTPRVEAIVRTHDADVVILDELFNHASTSDIASNLADVYPYRTPVVGQVCSGGGWTSVSGNCSNSPFVINGGTMILSKYPIEAQHALVFRNSKTGTWDYNANKGAALVRVNKNGVPAWVVGTHLQADQSSVSTDSTRATRVAQLAEIRNWVNGKVGTAGPVLIGGDLNIEYFAGQTGRAPGDSDLDRASRSGDAVLSTVDPTGPIRTMDCTVSAWCQYMAPIESFPVDYRDSLDYLGYLNYTDAAGNSRPTPGVDAVQVLVDPQDGWQPGQPDTYSPSDHYPIMTTFTLG
ncbi:sphingomyelin phosphodiesterase [Solihabitans fulvus]|uniref:sphingomyelin phosphodiesterase n=1 Tax=Solihabitans fulvus TaxID=1892852 RepID=UPI001CB767DD|nr:sphingomyelin phosphodiesterase [Solihabitans fulvus]